MERRTLLATVGTGMGIGIGTAGCLGFGTDSGGDGDEREGGDFPDEVETDDGAARFEIVGIERPNNVQVREAFRAEIAIGNSGGEAGQFSGALAIAEQGTGNTQTIDETASRMIDPGSVETFSLTQLTIPFAGEFDLTVEGYTNTVTWAEGAEASIVVEPMNGGIGDPYQLSDIIEVTPTAIRFEDALRYRTQARGGFSGGTGERIGLRSTVSDHIFAVVTVQVENGSREQVALEPGWLWTDPPGDLLTEFPGGTLNDEADLEIDPMNNATIDPGATKQGWFAFITPRSEAGELSLHGYANTGAENPEAIWTLTEGGVALPTFELAGMAVMERRRGPTDTFEYTVENTGDAAGTFCGATQWREVGTENWTYLEGEQIAHIEAGESATVQAEPTDDPGGRTFEYRFLPFDAQFTVEPMETDTDA